jgi:hydrogenase/urease accessory protein HupE
MTKRLVLIILVAAWASPAAAHPAPFSYLDLHLDRAGVTGTLVLHDLDVAHDLNVTVADSLLELPAASKYREALEKLMTPRLSLIFDGAPVTIAWTGLDVVSERQSLRLSFTTNQLRPGQLTVKAYIFPYDPIHQTFVNVYEGETLKHQAILDAGHQSLGYYSGTAQGRWSVIRTFVVSGIEHILIGPDHILFLIGLLLLGGTRWRLTAIVTSFTIGHSITLSLAALDIVSPPSRLVEPLIALTIIVVGADNLMVLRARQAPDPTASDIRAWLAAAFGLIHGFGFASVLKEFGLPRAALGWSLFSFNLGVEIGQLFIVVVAAGLLLSIARRSATAAEKVAVAGSIGVILAGLYWFIERVFFQGGM